jgi:hypothetical protein
LTLVVKGTRIDHLPGDHDDWANAVAGAHYVASKLSVQKIPIVPPFNATAPSYWASFESGARIPAGHFDTGGFIGSPPGGLPNPENELRRKKSI